MTTVIHSQQFQLTASQVSAVNAFTEFLRGSEQVLLVKGAAGTGKTTVIKEFIKTLEINIRSFALMAPTGRAAHILSNKTGKRALTIHKSIYSLNTVSAANQTSNSDTEVVLQAHFTVKKNDDPVSMIYIIDESSMISNVFSENEAFSFGSGCLLKDLFRYAGGRKLVFVGDDAQLPPIGMNSSPALDKEYIVSVFDCNVIEIVLDNVMRQEATSTMLTNAFKIRESIIRKSFVEFSLIKGNDTWLETNDLLAPYYKLSENRPNPRAAIITYSNKQALKYNLTLRKHYFGEMVPRLKSGDFLMIARNNYAYEYELFNGNIVVVESCAPDSDIEIHHVGVKIGNGHIESVDLRFRKATLRFNAAGTVASVNVMLLDNFLEDPKGSLDGMTLRALLVDFKRRLSETFGNTFNNIEHALKSSNPTPEQNELCNKYLDLLFRDPYYNAVICKYGYAMTCHKAQGGEWENVFVDMDRFGGTANENYFRWAYTALTRASKKIWLYRSPDFNYISRLVVEEIRLVHSIRISIYQDRDQDFCETRITRLRKICDSEGITVTEDRSKAYQHIIKFSSDEHNVIYQLWYNAKGYSGKDNLLNSTSDEFASLCKRFLEISLIPANIPFYTPDRPFAQKLVEFIKSLTTELGIQILNIEQEQYQDVFFLKTDGLARIGLIYTGKGNYSYMTLSSTVGSKDQKLEALRQKFI